MHETHFHDNLDPAVGQDAGSELRSTICLALIPRVCGEKGGRWGTPVGRLEGIWDEVRLVRVVEGSNRELELVCDLHKNGEMERKDVDNICYAPSRGRPSLQSHSNACGPVSCIIRYVAWCAQREQVP